MVTSADEIRAAIKGLDDMRRSEHHPANIMGQAVSIFERLITLVESQGKQIDRNTYKIVTHMKGTSTKWASETLFPLRGKSGKTYMGVLDPATGYVIIDDSPEVTIHKTTLPTDEAQLLDVIDRIEPEAMLDLLRTVLADRCVQVFGCGHTRHDCECSKDGA